jgi:hypothetical protein
MKKIQKKNNSIILVVLNEKENSISQERLRQSRIKFNLASTLVGVSATFCFTAIALFWSGQLSEDAVVTSINLISNIVTSYCLPLIKDAEDRLDSLSQNQEDNPHKK